MGEGGERGAHHPNNTNPAQRGSGESEVWWMGGGWRGNEGKGGEPRKPDTDTETTRDQADRDDKTDPETTDQTAQISNQAPQPRTEPESKDGKEGKNGRRLRVCDHQPGHWAPRPSKTAQGLAPNRIHGSWGRGAGT